MAVLLSLDAAPVKSDPAIISGDGWRRATRTPSGRALLAHDLCNGRVHLRGLTHWQVARITGAYRDHVRVVEQASEPDRRRSPAA
jgi:hypothetical protein